MTNTFVAQRAQEARVPEDEVRQAMGEAHQLVRGFSDEALWTYYASTMCAFYARGYRAGREESRP